MELFSVGGLGTLPRIFDAASPQEGEAGGGLGLGSPSQRRDGGGPGKGKGGEPGVVGENCVAQGNVLIIQEGSEKAAGAPGGGARGGAAAPRFPGEGGKCVSKIGLMDTDCTSTVTVVADEGESAAPAPTRGDNSAQAVSASRASARWVEVALKRSGATSFITFK